MQDVKNRAKSRVAMIFRARIRLHSGHEISNRHFLVRLETPVTHTKQTPATSSNRHFWGPIWPNSRVEFTSQS
jgi:hypothetical protein